MRIFRRIACELPWVYRNTKPDKFLRRFIANGVAETNALLSSFSFTALPKLS